MARPVALPAAAGPGARLQRTTLALACAASAAALAWGRKGPVDCRGGGAPGPAALGGEAPKEEGLPPAARPLAARPPVAASGASSLAAGGDAAQPGPGPLQIRGEAAAGCGLAASVATASGQGRGGSKAVLDSWKQGRHGRWSVENTILRTGATMFTEDGRASWHLHRESGAFNSRDLDVTYGPFSGDYLWLTVSHAGVGIALVEHEPHRGRRTSSRSEMREWCNLKLGLLTVERMVGTNRVLVKIVTKLTPESLEVCLANARRRQFEWGWKKVNALRQFRKERRQIHNMEVTISMAEYPRWLDMFSKAALVELDFARQSEKELEPYVNDNHNLYPIFLDYLAPSLEVPPRSLQRDRKYRVFLNKDHICADDFGPRGEDNLLGRRERTLAVEVPCSIHSMHCVVQ